MVPKRLVTVGACATMCMGALTLTVPHAAAISRAAAPHWRIVVRTSAGMLGPIVAPTATSAWAFGWGAHPPQGQIFPIGRHWNGHRWSGVRFPSGVKNSGMSCATKSSPTNVWAISGAGASGGNPPSTVSALRLRAGHWIIVKNFPGSYVSGCNVLSATNVWVFGGAVAGLGPPIGTWHLHGSTWTQIKTGHLVLFNASAVSATDIWATATDTSNSPPFHAVVARWNGRSWHEMRSIGASLPTLTSTTRVGLDNVNALSARNVWVLATVLRKSAESFLVVHWNGQRWSRVAPGRPGYYLPTAVPDGHGSWWSAPYLADGSVPYLVHRTHGRLAPIPASGETQGVPRRLIAGPGHHAPAAYERDARSGHAVQLGEPSWGRTRFRQAGTLSIFDLKKRHVASGDAAEIDLRTAPRHS